MLLADKKIGFIGGGNMAEAIIKGLLTGGISPSDILVGEPNEERRKKLWDAYKINAAAANNEIAEQSDVIILAVKPQAAQGVLGKLHDYVAQKLIISIMAGVKTETIES